MYPKWKLVILASIVITACVPYLNHDYYKPAAEGGIVKKSYCRGSSGPPSTIELKANEVIINVRANEVEDGIYVYFKMEVPKGRSVQLDTTYIYLFPESNQIAIKGTLQPIKYSGVPPWKIEESLIGETTEFKTVFGTTTYGKHFAMESRIVMPKPNIIKIKLPDLYINGQTVKLPEITFTKDKSTEIFAPINC